MFALKLRKWRMFITTFKLTSVNQFSSWQNICTYYNVIIQGTDSREKERQRERGRERERTLTDTKIISLKASRHNCTKYAKNLPSDPISLWIPLPNKMKPQLHPSSDILVHLKCKTLFSQPARNKEQNKVKEFIPPALYCASDARARNKASRHLSINAQWNQIFPR